MSLTRILRRWFAPFQEPQWHRWCTTNKHCDWMRNVDSANGDNSLAHGPVEAPDDGEADFRAQLLGVYSLRTVPNTKHVGTVD